MSVETGGPGGSGLAVEGLEAGWDGASVVRGAHLRVEPGEVVAVLGGNGSGKSSLLWAIAGLLPRRAGAVHLDGRRVDGLPAERRAALGLRLLPQSRPVFASLTVRENLEVVELGVGRPDVAAVRARRAALLERFPTLTERMDEPAASLSGGQRQLVALVRVLSTSPRVLLLDEPSAGLAPGLAARCGQEVAAAAAAGAAVVVVEQNTALARRLAGRVLQMREGRPVDDEVTAERLW